MLKSRLLHPEIREALGRAGHGSKILIADGNYPFATNLLLQIGVVFPESVDEPGARAGAI